MNSYSTSWWSLLLINRPREDERLSWPCWPTYSGRFTHINGYPSAAGPVQTSERSPVRVQCSTTELPNQHDVLWWCNHYGLATKQSTASHLTLIQWLYEKVVHTHVPLPIDIKQHNLVLANGRWCSVKVTMDLLSVCLSVCLRVLNRLLNHNSSAAPNFTSCEATENGKISGSESRSPPKFSHHFHKLMQIHPKHFDNSVFLLTDRQTVKLGQKHNILGTDNK